MATEQHPGFIALAGGIFVAVVTAISTWVVALVTRKPQLQIADASTQHTLVETFKELLNQMRTEREAMASELTKMKKALDDSEIKAAAERAQLRGEIINLTQTIQGLKRLLRRHGIDLPEDWEPGPPVS